MSVLKTVTVTAENTWTPEIDIGEDAIAYVRCGVSGTVGSSKVRVRWYDPDLPTHICYSDDVLVTSGQTYQTAIIPGPAKISAGSKTGEVSGANMVVSLRVGLKETK